MAADHEETWNRPIANTKDCSGPESQVEKLERTRTWEEELLGNLVDELMCYRSNPAALERETELLIKACNEAEIKRLDIGVEIAVVEMRQSAEREKLIAASQSKQQCSQKLVLNGECMQRLCSNYNTLQTYVSKKNGELLAINQELVDVKQGRKEVCKEISDLYYKGYPENSTTVGQLAAEDGELSAKEEQLITKRRAIKNEVQVGHENMKQISLDANKLRSEEQNLKQQLEALDNKENYLQNESKKFAKLLDELKRNLKVATRTETLATKSLLKLVFIKGIIKSDEREKTMLQAVELDVQLVGNIAEKKI